MVTATGLNTTLSIVEGAATVLSKGKASKVGEIVADNIDNIVRNRDGFAARYDRAGSAISTLTAQTNILSRMFVEESLLAEPVLPHLTKTIHEWYAAQILSALHLNQLVSDGRSVQDVMSVVQTGHNERQNGLLGNIVSRRMGQESFLESYHGESFTSNANLGIEAYGDMIVKKAADFGGNGHTPEAVEDKTDYKNVTVRSVKASESRIGPMGELFEVKLSNPGKEGASITVPVYVQIQPTIIPDGIAPRFVDMNVPASTWQRWTMMRAGELTFWKDFLFHRDSAKRQRAIFKDAAKSAVFTDYLRTIAKKDKYALADATDSLSSGQSSNLANSVMIMSEDAIHQAKIDSGIDLHNPRDRQRYFHNTYTMILAVIDPLHQRVTTYFNGLDGESNSSYSDFRPNTKDFNPQEFMAAMQAFSTNNIGRMR